MFKSTPPKPNTAQMEDVLMRFWKAWRIRERCEEGRRGGGEFVYYETPPSPSSKPDFPQIITRAFSDLFLRYKTMRGYHILRRSGWQAHGLPVELLAAQQLGLSGKSQTEEFGIANFNQGCRKTLDYYAPYWERMNDHLGYWVDPQEAYLTITNEYIESVWWAVKSLWDKGLLYQALKVLPYCPSCGVHLSKNEIAQGGEKTSEPLICVRLPFVNGPGTSLLVLTKAPWTLVGNVAVAVNPEAEYITIEQEAPGGGLEHLVVAQKSATKIFGETSLKVVDKFKGRKLKGEAYFPLYTFILPHKTAHFVIVDDFIREEIGTGLVHIAPSFNEQDLHIAQEYDLPLLNPITDAGEFIPEVRPWSGKFVKDANPFIIQDLDARGLLFKAEAILQTEPHCMYCGSPVLDYTHNGWFIRISQFPDKALGYDRYWGAPLPIWECQTCHHQVCVGSVDELSKLAGAKQTELDLHRPFIDDIFLICPECHGQLARVSELVIPWFESACMPFASWHYPFENQTLFERQFPADLICTSIEHSENWLKDLQIVSGILLDRAGYKNAISLKSLATDRGPGKPVDPMLVAEPMSALSEWGADVFRWHILGSWQSLNEQPITSKAFTGSAIKAAQKTISMLWNVYAFFVVQANQDEWQPTDIPQNPTYQVLDHWLRSELHTLTLNVTTAFDTYDPYAVVECLQKFIHKLSRWYIRQSKTRFARRKMDADKAAAYAVLYETLTTLCKLCAPVIPFQAEEMYQNLLGNTQSQNLVSVHLTDWPIADLPALDAALMSDMEEVVNLASLGRSARRTANIPLYQPLSEIAFFTHLDMEKHRSRAYSELLKNELKIKDVKFLDPSSLAESYPASHPQYLIVSQGAYQVVLVTQLTPELIDEGVARQVIRRVNALRKQAGLGKHDHIRLYIKAAPVLSEAIYRFRQSIMNEALVDEMSEPLAEKTALSQFEINGKSILIGIEKIH